MYTGTDSLFMKNPLVSIIGKTRRFVITRETFVSLLRVDTKYPKEAAVTETTTSTSTNSMTLLVIAVMNTAMTPKSAALNTWKGRSVLVFTR